jgi:adenosylcobinamide-phosphate synthase
MFELFPTPLLPAHLPGGLLVLPAAMALDLVMGDPRWLPHPVRWMGSAISALESWMRRAPLPELPAGAIHTLSLVPLAWGAALAAQQAAFALGRPWGLALETLLVYYSLSLRSLVDAAMAVFHPLAAGDLPAARARLAEIVGRDVAALDAAGIARATVETVAENLVDGVLAPLFFAALGGAPLAMAYKMVNTLDSMVGYRNVRYLYFGRAAARLDDLANLLPARLAVPLVALACALLGSAIGRPWRTALRQGRRHLSPNSGYPEAAFAGALGVWLGGPNRYGGRLVAKPVIGEGLAAARPDHIPRACILATLSAALGLAACWSLQLLRILVA